MTISWHYCKVKRKVKSHTRFNTQTGYFIVTSPFKTLFIVIIHALSSTGLNMKYILLKLIKQYQDHSYPMFLCFDYQRQMFIYHTFKAISNSPCDGSVIALHLPVHCEACSLSQGAGPTASVSSGIWLEKNPFLSPILLSAVNDVEAKIQNYVQQSNQTRRHGLWGKRSPDSASFCPSAHSFTGGECNLTRNSSTQQSD